MSAFEPYPSDAATTEAAAPQPVADDERLATRWSRVWALLVDSLLIGVIAFAIGLAGSLALGTDDISDDGLRLIFTGIGLLAAFLYAPPLLARRGAHNGQTLGKQLLRIRVVTREGVPVTLGRALRREVLGVTALNVVTTGLYALVDYPFGLFDRRRQCVHDKIGGTYVYKASVPSESAAPGWPPPLTEEAAPQEWAQPVSVQDSPQHAWQPPSAPARPPVTPPSPPDHNDAARRAFGE
jgi:uncharacterized RDD family membrane protein YckC